MKEMDAYGLRLCKYQAELFRESAARLQCSSGIFIRRFMYSDLAARIDTEGFYYTSTDIGGAFEELDLQYGASDYGKEKFGAEELYWIGYLYRYWSYISGKSSKQIYRQVKPDELRALYFPYHSLDPEQAIERIREAKKIDAAYDFERSVAIVRAVREGNNYLSK